MNTELFRQVAPGVMEFLVFYRENLSEWGVTTTALPGFLEKQLKDKAPLKPQCFDKIMKDFKEIIIPGLCNWGHKGFFAYFSGGISYPSTLGELLLSGLGSMASSWEDCPILTDLEHHTIDLYCRMIGFPKKFRYEETNGVGGGMVENSASEAIYNAMLVARNRMMDSLGQPRDAAHLSKLVAYCSDEAHSCVEKAAILQQVTCRTLENDENQDMRGHHLEEAMRKDKADGLIPFFALAIVGSTSSAAVDYTEEIADVVAQYPGVWYHCDCSYGGSYMQFEQFKHTMKGIGRADSFNINPYKCGLTTADGVFFMTADRAAFLKHLGPVSKFSDVSETSESENPLNSTGYLRRFRILRHYITMRSYGKKGMRDYLQRCMNLSKRLENLLRNDDDFEVMNNVRMGVVLFRLRPIEKYDSDELTDELMKRVNDANLVHFIPTRIDGHFVIRFAPSSEDIDEDAIDLAYDELKSQAFKLLSCPKSIMRKNNHYDFTVEVPDEEVMKARTPNVDFDCVPVRKSRLPVM